MSAKRYLVVGVIAAGTIFLGGCVVAPADPYYVSQPIMVAPPPPRVEVVGVAPFPGQIWINGYWGWSGNHHQWVPGRWETPPRGHRWAPHRWVQEGPHWREQHGHWDRH